MRKKNELVIIFFYVDYIFGFLKFQDNIERIVRNICNIMPSSVKKQCNDFVDQYGDAVIQLLIETLKPNEICPMLKLCDSQFLRTMHGKCIEMTYYFILFCQIYISKQLCWNDNITECLRVFKYFLLNYEHSNLYRNIFMQL